MLSQYPLRRTNRVTTRFLTPVITLVLAAGIACSTNDITGLQEIVYTPWTMAISAEQMPGTSAEFNSVSLDGCPFIAPDGKKFYMASNRAGGLGGIDIWVSTRAKVDDPWGAPVNVGAPVNTASNDFCPTMTSDGHTFFFVSNRSGADTCGGDDIYVTNLGSNGTFDAPKNLGCTVNSAGNEAGPFQLTLPGSNPVLYFSSTRAGGFAAEAPGAITGDADIYSSQSTGGSYTGSALVADVNTDANEIQPNLQQNGFEMFFASNRSGVAGTTGTLGGNDIFVATRASAQDPWRAPTNLGSSVNSSTGDESRPSLSWDGLTLYFGSTRPGGEGASDIYLATRQRSN